jgi:carbonic anhydrase
VSTTDVTISGGGLVNSDYQLAQFHFHWGDSSSSGSEHTIDNNHIGPGISPTAKLKR